MISPTTPALFFFAALSLVGALFVPLAPTVFSSVLAWLVALLGVAGLWIGMEAYFLATLQVLLYAGAVMVLFLFVVMLVGLQQEAPVSFRRPFVYLSIALVLLELCRQAFKWEHSSLEKSVWIGEALPTSLPFSTSVGAFGYALFGKYVLVVEWLGILLLTAIVAVVWVGQSGRSHEHE